METNDLIAKATEAVDVALRIKEAASSSLIEGTDGFDTDLVVPCNDASRDLLEKYVSSENDTKLAKVLAASTMIAKSVGAIELENDSVEYISSLSDEVSTRYKTAYQVATGQIDIEEAGEKIIDAASSRLIVFADNLIDNDLPIAVNIMADALSCYYPPAAPIANVIKRTVPFFLPKIKSVVRKGINAVAVKAKQALPNIIHWAKEKALSFANKLLSIA